MTINDHVKILSGPHAGETGKIKCRWIATMSYDWIVRLSNQPLDCAVREKDIERVE